MSEMTETTELILIAGMLILFVVGLFGLAKVLDD